MKICRQITSARSVEQGQDRFCLWLSGQVACGYIYEPERGEPKNGIPPGTAFKDLPADYMCPVCGAYAKVGKQAFIAID